MAWIGSKSKHFHPPPPPPLQRAHPRPQLFSTFTRRAPHIKNGPGPQNLKTATDQGCTPDLPLKEKISCWGKKKLPLCHKNHPIPHRMHASFWSDPTISYLSLKPLKGSRLFNIITVEVIALSNIRTNPHKLNPNPGRGGGGVWCPRPLPYLISPFVFKMWDCTPKYLPKIFLVTFCHQKKLYPPFLYMTSFFWWRQSFEDFGFIPFCF